MKKISFSKIFMTALVLGLLGAPGAYAQTNMEEFMAKWDNGKKFTLDVVDKMPDDLLDYSPHESAMNFTEMVTHVAGSIAGLSEGFMLGESPGFDLKAKPQTKEELKKFINDCYDYGKKTISNLTEEQLSEEIDTFAGKITRRQMLSLIDDHAIHHRGAAISYIRANGIEPPAFTAL